MHTIPPFSGWKISSLPERAIRYFAGGRGNLRKRFQQTALFRDDEPIRLTAGFPESQPPGLDSDGIFAGRQEAGLRLGGAGVRAGRGEPRGCAAARRTSATRTLRAYVSLAGSRRDEEFCRSGPFRDFGISVRQSDRADPDRPTDDAGGRKGQLHHFASGAERAGRAIRFAFAAI